MSPEQKAFEAHMQAAGGMSPHCFSGDGNEYEYVEVQRHWLTWSASSSSRSEEVESALLAYLEGQKFHPSASHVPPDYRDGFNCALQVVINRIHVEQEMRARSALKENNE